MVSEPKVLKEAIWEKLVAGAFMAVLGCPGRNPSVGIHWKGAKEKEKLSRDFAKLTIKDLGQTTIEKLVMKARKIKLGKELKAGNSKKKEKGNPQEELSLEWKRSKWKKRRVRAVRDSSPGSGPANHVNSNQARNIEPKEEEPEEEESGGEKLDDTNDEDSEDFILVKNEDGEA
ncbi:hypothetical protein L1987_43605 [Smallanthus sonchifolius]|uniref:Uncharacterized protein n=1 Tax=Smallanthus sonchifolius TaxID=185202 RepID=A0ACB9GMS8_9ASTR|nr:hypothetical protein L1987_43605 [Smallanthus sonchifolius]